MTTVPAISPEDLESVITRGVSEIISRDEFIRLLQSGKKLRLKMGFDPIRPVMKRKGSAVGAVMFLAYSASLGVTVSALLLQYTGPSVAQAFFTTAGAFAGLTVFAFVTKRDLSGVGNFCMVGLFGIIIASVVNIFMASSAMHFAISVLGVLIFAGLTAYDTQKMKDYALSQDTDNEVGRRASIMAALELYLDFILMFIYLTRILGASRD